MQQESQNVAKQAAKRWHPVVYGDKNRYAFWSEKILGKGDIDLSETAEGFKKFIVLKVLGKTGTVISIGFVSGEYHKTMIMDTDAAITDIGFVFSMGMDRSDCEFFVASNDGEVKLELGGYKNNDDPELQKIPMF